MCSFKNDGARLHKNFFKFSLVEYSSTFNQKDSSKMRDIVYWQQCPYLSLKLVNDLLGFHIGLLLLLLLLFLTNFSNIIHFEAL